MLFTVVILAIAVFLNLLIGELPSSATKIDVSENKLYSIGDETKNVASSLTEDVTLYLLAEDGSEDATLNELLTRYADLSSHIKYEKKGPGSESKLCFFLYRRRSCFQQCDRCQ